MKLKMKLYEKLFMEVNANLYLMDRKTVEYLAYKKKSTIIRVAKKHCSLVLGINALNLLC